ncbi:MAG: OmpA family protein [Campylobacterales bacterium]|nr:OmpA family protein [Campylobacterales bacterium]
MKKLWLSISVSAMLVSSAVATDMMISPVVTKNVTKDSSQLDDYFTYGAKVSKKVTNSVYAQFGYEYAKDVDIKNTTKETDLNRFIVNGVYEFGGEKVVPYLFAGGGYETVNNSTNLIDDQAVLNAGVGLRYAVNESLDVLTEGRYLRKVESEDNDLGVTLGINFKFNEPKKEVVPEVKKEAPKVVEKPKEVKVELPKDSDFDTVVDTVDNCPATPKGLKVDKKGCALNYNFYVNFDFDKADIKAQYYPKVKEFAEIMKNNPALKATIEGHTDAQGSDAYNQKLSQKRADSVMNALIKEGIAKDRLKAVGYGKTKPVADNATSEGRYQNRRVEANTNIK